MKLRLGSRQIGALSLYVFDPAVIEGRAAFGEPPFPGRLDASTLTLDPGEAAARDASVQLCEAANSADCDGDAELRDALTALVRRVVAGIRAMQEAAL